MPSSHCEPWNVDCPSFARSRLGRNTNETRSVVEAAKKANRLLGIDLAYRFTTAMQAIHSVISSSELGKIYAANLVFHNAYGPDKEWFYDRSRSGGGCVMDLGIHLIDAALWILSFPKVLTVNSRLYSQGRQLDRQSNAVEDYASAQIDTDSGVTLNMQCSWRAFCRARLHHLRRIFWQPGGRGFSQRERVFLRFCGRAL